MIREELEIYYALYLSPGIGSKRCIALYDYFGSAEQAYGASRSKLMQVPGFGKNLADDFISCREDSRKMAAKQLAKLPENVTITTYYDTEYPEHLKKIYQPPALLF